ncbi:hypothetical protein L596_028050 [Steinernema carpocapsae]|uniref:Uncharacterized protein n=1 Tax=Steinernema carpocapsae TaxID=34508 RepID=A0A4U5LXC5_STECR|nr:hypothetical protein L596_028050 [Steinernema carpocapsae]
MMCPLFIHGEKRPVDRSTAAPMLEQAGARRSLCDTFHFQRSVDLSETAGIEVLRAIEQAENGARKMAHGVPKTGGVADVQSRRLADGVLGSVEFCMLRRWDAAGDEHGNVVAGGNACLAGA